jgi:Transposase DDE domain group 1
MAKDTRWDRNLSVAPDAEGLIGHAGAVLLRKLADQCGLTPALGAALGRKGKFPLIDRGMALVSMAVAIALGATSMNDIALLAHQEGAAPTFKSGYGFHPLGAWCANTAESLAMLLRPGNAGPDTFADHLTVLTAAIRQIPARMRSKLLVRVDGVGASHELISHLLSLATPRRRVLFTCGWAITEADEQAIGLLPATAWQAAVDLDGAVQQDKHVAEVTHLMRRAGRWPAGLRWVVRRTRPSRRQARNLTAFERSARLAVLHHLHQHPGRARDTRRARQPPRPVHRRAAPPARRRRRRRPHREIDGPAESPVEDMDGELRVGTRRQPRRRPVRLDPAARPVRLRRLRRPRRRRARHAALPAAEPARPARPPRPAARAEDQPHLALETGIPDLLAAAMHPARTA